MKDVCGCGNKAITPKPAKFSPDDKYGSYRRKAKLEMSKTDPTLKWGVGF